MAQFNVISYIYCYNINILQVMVIIISFSYLATHTLPVYTSYDYVSYQCLLCIFVFVGPCMLLMR